MPSKTHLAGHLYVPGGNPQPITLIADAVGAILEGAIGTFTCSPFILETQINSVGGAVTANLPDGTYEGQRKIVSMSDATASSTLSVTSHETSSPEVFTFAQTTDYLVLEWSRSQAFWWTVKNIGVAT